MVLAAMFAAAALSAPMTPSRLDAVCGGMDWQWKSDECAQKAGLAPAWAYFKGQVRDLAARKRITRFITPRLSYPGDSGFLAWTFPAEGMPGPNRFGYGMGLSFYWLPYAPYNSLRVAAAHEVCHISNGDFEIGTDVDRYHNDPGSIQHLRVYRCIIDLLGENAYSQWLHDQFKMDADQRALHLQWIRDATAGSSPSRK